MPQSRARDLQTVVAEFEAARTAYQEAASANSAHWRKGTKLRETKNAAHAKLVTLQKELHALAEVPES